LSAPDHKGERDAAVAMVRGLLLGPLDEGETIPSAPVDTYLTGILWPAGEPLGAMEDEADDGAPASEDGETDAAVPGYRTVRPCSIGLTFAADADATVVVSLADTARYEPEERETEEGRPERHWHRVPLGYSYEIPAGGAATWSTREFRNAGGPRVTDDEVRLHIRRRVHGQRQVVTATLVNEAVESDDTMRPQPCLRMVGSTAREHR